MSGALSRRTPSPDCPISILHISILYLVLLHITYQPCAFVTASLAKVLILSCCSITQSSSPLLSANIIDCPLIMPIRPSSSISISSHDRLIPSSLHLLYNPCRLISFTSEKFLSYRYNTLLQNLTKPSLYSKYFPGAPSSLSLLSPVALSKIIRVSFVPELKVCSLDIQYVVSPATNISTRKSRLLSISYSCLENSGTYTVALSLSSI